ncbi:OmpA family protein [Pelomonas sp. BJYL3]|uniref:OmpA family protein n=1 Tax=Pelomonas sp. BJYL3 TaxID=2976697 RepID=UPI0022B5D628|nr:OmpA family protein [Pelomonas sp. BJYL3]
MASIRALGAGALLALGTALSPLPSRADVPAADVPGGNDHPVLRRFTGSVLVGFAQQDWEQSSFPDASGVAKNGDKFANPQTLEGKITRLFYLAPLDKGPLEVFRNHQQALQAAGFKTVWTCESKEQGCTKAYFALDKNQRLRGMSWAKGDLPNMSKPSGGRWSLEASITTDGGRMLAGQLTQGGRTLHLLLYTSLAQNDYTHRTATYIEIIEPKAMPTGQVTVDAGAIGQGLKAEGKVALYGLFFDTGKSEVKPESQAQLAEMAQVLKADPKLRVFIVGHTDNVGGFEANQVLSLARAQAVVAALGKPPYGIEASRLSAKGAANIAPLASNADEDGRARNRRVEMVLQ